MRIRRRDGGAITEMEMREARIVEVLKDSPSGVVARARVGPGMSAGLVVKVRVLSLVDGVKMLVGGSRLQRQWDGAQAVAGLGLGVVHQQTHR